MKKLTKSSLEELAQTMPVLSEQEQSLYVGGDIYIMDQNGRIIDTQSSSTAHGLLIQGTGPDNSGVYTDLESGVMPVAKKYDIEESGVVVGQGEELCFEGENVKLSLFEFLANNTKVEWGMSYNKGEDGGYLDTRHQESSSTHRGSRDKYDSFVHNHAGGTGASPDDIVTFDEYNTPNEKGNSYENFSIYNEQTGEYEEYKKVGDKWLHNYPS